MPQVTVGSEKGPYGRKEDWPGSEEEAKRLMSRQMMSLSLSRTTLPISSAVHHNGRQQSAAGKRIFEQPRTYKSRPGRRSADQTRHTFRCFFDFFSTLLLLLSTIFFCQQKQTSFFHILKLELEHDLLLLHKHSHHCCTCSLLTLIPIFCSTI